MLIHVIQGLDAEYDKIRFFLEKVLDTNISVSDRVSIQRQV
jgi:hypothetical protein